MDPWLSQMPELLERLDRDSATPVWRARDGSGEDLIAKKLPAAEPGQRAAVIDQLRALQRARAPHLEPVAGAAERDGDLWVLLRPAPGLSLRRVLQRRELSPGQAIHIAIGILQGLDELHGLGLGHSRLDDHTIHIDALGGVRLSDCWSPAGESPDQRGEVRRAGELVCAALGIAVRAGGPLTAAERQTPAVAATARSLAAGSAPTAATALGLLVDSAGLLGTPGRLEQSRRELAEVVRPVLGPVAPAALAPAPPPPAPPAIGPRPTRESTWAARPPPRPRPTRPGWLLPAALIAALALVGFVAASAIAARIGRGPGPTAAASPAARSTARPSPPAASAPSTPRPTAAPTSSSPPASAGDVTGVRIAPAECAPGATCALTVDVNLRSLPQAQPVSWVFKIRDRCSGAVVERPGTTVSAQQGWILVEGNASVQIPSGKAFEVIAETSAPAVAASPPLSIGGSC